MDYTKAQMEYISSVDGKAHQSAVEIIGRLEAQLKKTQAIVNGQAEDGGLWFIAHTASEAYLQQQLRKLHAAIEKGE